MAQVKIEVGAIRFAVNGGAEVIAQEREAFTDFLKHKMGEDILAAQQRRRKAQPFHREPDDTMNARRVLNCNITPWLLKSAIEEGHLDRIIRPFDEIDIPLDTGGTVTAVCGYSDSCSARFVFKDCWDEAVMNEEATNKGGYFKSKGRAHVLVDVLPHIAQEWRAIFKPRQLSEIIDGETVEYADLLWLPSATDMFGPSEEGYWKDIDDSFQLEIFKRERDRVKECGDNGTYPYWLRSVRATSTASFGLVITDGGGGYATAPATRVGLRRALTSNRKSRQSPERKLRGERRRNNAEKQHRMVRQHMEPGHGLQARVRVLLRPADCQTVRGRERDTQQRNVP